MRVQAILKYLFFISLVLSILPDFFIPQVHSYATSWWYELPGFDSAYGFAGCIFIIMVAKILGKYWLQRKEDYYD
jgi:hypothetical protein